MVLLALAKASANLVLSSAAAFPQVGQSVQLGVTVSDSGGPGGFTWTADLVNLANGNIEGHFFTEPGGAGSTQGTGVAIANGSSTAVMYAPIKATAADIAGYDASQGLGVQISLNGQAPLTLPKVVFLPMPSGAAALEIVSVSGAQWSAINSSGSFMYAVVSVTNPSSQTGQATLRGIVLVDGVQREAFGYPTVTVPPGGTVTQGYLTQGTVTNELAGQIATPVFQLVMPGTGAPIGAAVSGQGLVIPSAAQAGGGAGVGVPQGNPLDQ